MFIKQMGKIIEIAKTLREGYYIGPYKKDEFWYYHFKPDVMWIDNEKRYFRIGDHEEEFSNDRTYIIRVVNKKEQELINKVN